MVRQAGAKLGRIDILVNNAANYETVEFEKLTVRQWDAMFASNESSAVGAAQAIKGRGSKVKLVGFDWSPGLLDDLKSGLIDSLVIQDPFQMGYIAVTTAVKHLNGQSVTKMMDMQPRLITRESLDDPAVQAQLHPDLKKYLE